MSDHLPYAPSPVLGYPLRVGTVSVEARIALVARCAVCGQEKIIIGRLLDDITGNATSFADAHADCGVEQ